MTEPTISRKAHMRRWIRDHGLSITLFALFLATLAGQSAAGHRTYNQEQREHRERPVSYAHYLTTGNFVESVFENWESEFLQMASYVLLTVFLFQRGSAESKDPDSEDPSDADPRKAVRKDSPWPVRRGGWVLTLYENSLGITLGLLFLMSFLLHAAGGVREFNQDQLLHGGHTISYVQYFTTSQMWFESFQNWQSEYLAVGIMVVFTIFLRQRHSPESKLVAAPYSVTGN
jgi:hypothetical protein